MKAKAGMGSASVSSIKIEDAKTLAGFVNNTANSVESGLAALTIVMQNAAGLTPISDIISAATEFDKFISESVITASAAQTLTQATVETATAETTA